MDPHLYEGKVLNIEHCDQIIPQFSKWERKGKICCFNIAYFPEIKSYFINQWECNCKFPPIVLILFFLSLVAGLWSAIANDKITKKYKIVIVVVLSIVFMLWFISYMLCMCRSPGYVPFYWAVERREEYTYEEQMDGIITNNDQFNFAKSNDRPQRGSLSIQARRLVLRADHVCKWVSNWIGLKNYRLFYLQLFWTFWTFMVFFVIIGLEIWSIVDAKKFTATAPRVLICILILPDLGFFLFFMTIFLRHTKYLFHNETTLGEFKKASLEDKHNYYDLGCCANIRETCGPCSYCPVYLCPFPIPRVNDGYEWKVNRDNDPDQLPEYPKVTEEYVRACPTVEENERGKPVPTYEQVANGLIPDFELLPPTGMTPPPKDPENPPANEEQPPQEEEEKKHKKDKKEKKDKKHKKDKKKKAKKEKKEEVEEAPQDIENVSDAPDQSGSGSGIEA
ncbi:DHHC zinc finger domain containing protein [Trichomonas vaginalis G3]|uniref:Palmitoyltransferase n=1 Tax=Trichomonas vaginalis (strain ATCC PRA-98 / G3) TaxID=412133 RepID=A2ES12_TRIV3|nr:cysteine S-palmitoyltransferase protein [Trichomonas vaginalis G3]EAY04524.1 DHHC zinc finger domain containing protein [Trichomonas vaginalis G3]KAI5508458.1 cysteine S-palmitoyltransferase protein [Trichomonas vaginalis G3]|eukprot:XP_001316747.1 DHHC zinc finger domain containing protein [Trichomonas vaginalis G3]